MGKIIIHYILWILSLLSNSTTDTDEIIRKTGSSFSKSYELNYKGVTEEIERVAERTVNIRPRKLYGWEDIYKITLGRGWKMHQRQEIQCIAKELENTTGNNSCKTKKWEGELWIWETKYLACHSKPYCLFVYSLMSSQYSWKQIRQWLHNW